MTTVVAMMFLIIGYFSFFHNLISLVASEFKKSKFVDVLEKLIRILEEEEKDYKVIKFNSYTVFILVTL
jgi:hypothetical protein